MQYKAIKKNNDKKTLLEYILTVNFVYFYNGEIESIIIFQINGEDKTLNLLLLLLEKNLKIFFHQVC